MGLMTYLARGVDAVGTSAKSAAGGSVSTASLPALGSIPSASGLLVSQATAMAVATVSSCVRMRASYAARCTPRLVDARDRRKEIFDHPLARLLRRPNRQQTWYEFVEMTVAGTLLRGNGYCVKLRDAYGVVDELIPVNPDLVTVLEVPDGRLFYTVSRAGLWLVSALQDMPVSIPEEDVVHLRGLSFNLLMGASRISLGRDAIGLAMSQEQQAARWAGNGARPAGVLQSPGKMTDEAAKRLKAQWEAFQAGVQNAGRTAVLESGIEWKPMQLTSVDLEFLKSREFQAREICRHFDVHPALVGEADVGKATLTELNADFVRRVVMDDVTRIEQKLEREFDLDTEGLALIFDNRELLRADPKTQMDLARVGVLGGLTTQNEGRDSIGLPPVDGGDVLLAPSNLAPNGSAIDGRAPGNGGRPPAGEEPLP